MKPFCAVPAWPRSPRPRLFRSIEIGPVTSCRTRLEKKDVPHLRIRPELHLDGAAVGLIDDAVGDRDVLRIAAAEAEHRPARAEGAVGHRHELATAEQRAGVVLRLHVAVADVDILAADEVEAVVVAVDAVVDVDAVDPHVIALDDAHGMKRAGHQKDDRACGDSGSGERAGGRGGAAPPRPDGGGTPRVGLRNCAPCPSMVPGPSMVTFSASTAKIRPTLPSSSVESPRSGMASAA